MAHHTGGYQQPQDTYMHSNASQFDNQYQSGGYRDEPGYTGQQTPQSDYYGAGGDGTHDSARYGAGAGAVGGTGYNPAQESANKYSYAPPKKTKSKKLMWIIIAIVALIVIIGAVLGGVFGSRAASSSSSGSGGSGSGSEAGSASSFSGQSAAARVANIPSSVSSSAAAAASAGGKNDVFFDGTDLYGNPYWVSSNLDASAPAQGEEVVSCSDSNTPDGTLSATSLRSHPRLMTTGPEWSCLPQKIAKDAYLTVWNASIFANASAFYDLPPINYTFDGDPASGSGILDPARETQLRIKTWAYAYMISNDTKWLDRTWTEMVAVAGNSTTDVWDASEDIPGATKNETWNPDHFLDLAELTAAFAIGYDWLYDAWKPSQREAIMWTIITFGLNQGVDYYKTGAAWWSETLNGNGNWNCVCNSGLILGALAIWSEDPTDASQTIINEALPNMRQNCMRGAGSDGTWSETPNYWYFGTNAQARALSALISSTGSDQGLSAANSNWNLTGQYHMYVGGQAGLFAYGDNGPNKFSTNANGMFLWGKLANLPIYSLYQRDRADAADPLSMFWYDTGVTGSFWNGLALDKFFNNNHSSWGSMRSSWTDFTGTYVAMRAGNATGSQTHGDLDAGDFVIDALGTRWAGEYGSGNYLSTDYFTSEAQNAVRWQYYRKGTQGQNTLVINKENQAASCLPTNTMDSTGATQSSSINYVPGTSDIAYFITDMSDCYNQTSGTIKRGIRFLNGRRQVLLQDEVSGGSGITSIEWRVQTNATISLNANKTQATLTISQVTDANSWGNLSDPLVSKLPQKQTMLVSLINSGSATFAVETPPARVYGSDPNTASGEQGDQPNPGVSVLKVDFPSTTGMLQVLWQPQWENLGDADKATPNNVSLSNWSLTSH
ncbi:hypothetical protein BCV69DRAFT_272086 [Microstroma glucosiphilum]|uniref:Heparinase II/III-like C-terminal domain-containing protein n=1 Tax=Pseudomicrostroma glucosiphilum TaxID=1684307 RepID=A0A316U296_9BASI|nr:hypothetical protein BCV69DRAFT_272086 [Pseudomicrostroma glucosiphilum]PWN19472.1 hypothetical protein BCV69DRAFT_272086 [Pseudomicrostroma glucosiphilum]